MAKNDEDSSEPNKPEQRDKPEQELSAEQLLKVLDIQLSQSRKAPREHDARMSFRVWSLVIILAGTLLALFALEWLLSMVPRPEHRPPGATPVPTLPAR